ncbi:MAG: hypothetical protein QOI61_1755, partial [Actinomycetota bacterium]
MSFAEWADAPRAETLEPIVVVSPHFDDAVQGAGLLLARHPGSTVLTVFAGPPPAYPDPPSDWDALGGFVSGDDVVALRRIEDAAALDVVGAVPRWLEMPDHQYFEPAGRSGPDAVAALLRDALHELNPASVFVPFGLGNPDHDVTHLA